MINSKFYNIQSKQYDSKRIHFIKNEKLEEFLISNELNKFDFMKGIFSLYLSRIDRTEGCILKSDKDLFECEYNENDLFIDYLNKITPINDENSVDCFYIINDFTELNEVSNPNYENYALILNLYSNELELAYNTELFNDTYIEHMLLNINSLIDDAVSNPNLKCKDLSILSNEDQNLNNEFCKGDHIYVDENKTLSLAFRENAEKNPDNIAVDDGITQITYLELDKSSNSIAHDLHNNYNINKGSPVCLMISRNYHFIELVLALNKIGAVAVPIDSNYPLKRIEHMINISKSENIIISDEYEDLYDFNINEIYVNELNADNEVDLDIECSGDDLFGIMFTSGTTGLPKGVRVLNKQITGTSYLYKREYGFDVGDVVGCYASFGFVASYQMYNALISGGCIRIFNDDERKDSLLLLKTLKETQMKLLALPPSVGIPIFENEDLQLEYMVLAGAKINELKNKNSSTKIVNYYGATEVILATLKIYDLNNMDNRVPLGRPIINTNVYILDKNNKQVPVGVPGEICIAGEYMSPGYIGDVGKGHFIDNPYFDGENCKRMYKTGDIGFYDFDGEIEIIGREDDQLSIRGYRVESDEILNVLKNYPIAQTYLDDENDNLTLYYTKSSNLDIDEVKTDLKSELPEYMVPSFFIEVDKMPLNINGKIDKFALRNINKNNVHEDIDDEVLKKVIDGFKQVLNQDYVLMNDDFVSLGGNSISAMTLQLFIKNQFNVNLSSNKIIELSTPFNISNHIKFNLETPVDEVNYDFSATCPLSESQLNVYLDEIANDMGTGYNNSFKIKFNNKYSADKIKEALERLFDVYPILSARVLIHDDVPSFIFDVKPQVSESSADDIETFVQPFNVEEYLARFLIVENDDVITLCMDFHHLIFDGTSLDILLEAFIDILEGNPVDFIDNGVLRQISYEENNIVNSEYMDNASEFFEKSLADIDETSELLPLVTDSNIDDEYVDYLKIDNDYLDSFLKENSITYNQFFTSVFAYTLSRFTGSSKVLFNLIEDGRGYVDLSKSVGMFVRTLPLLMDCENRNVESFLEYSSQLVNTTMNYDLYPYRILANEYDLNSGVFFQYAHNIGHDSLNNNVIKDLCELKHDLQGDMAIYIFNSDDDEYQFKVLFSDKFDKKFIKRFIDTYKLILNEMTKVNQLSDINYISNEDLMLLDDLNDTEVDLKYDEILDAFNDNLSNYPDNKLVSYNDVSYSYGEGAFIAQRIAKSLTELGVEHQDCVGFLVPRSELYMFSVLGIMSLGAVYVPLDDKHPDERVNFIINDSNAKVVIVSDETYSRARELTGNFNILNISDIVNGETESLDNLPISYGELACILYTSGTTGTPKGVKVTSKSILNLSHNYADKNNLSVGDVYGLYASIGFDAASQAICQTFYAGATLSVIPEDIRLNIEKLNEYMINQRINHVMMTTPVGKLFMENADNEILDVLTVGGEKLGDFENHNDYELIDGYGPTETFAFITSIDNSLKIDSSSIGMINDNTKAYILDNDGRRVPYGAVGELCISGFQVADGYLNREEETTKAFVSNPFEDNSDYDVLYRSGDMVRALPDGSLGIVGRRDSQVKIRGNRVELSAVESVIREIDYINDVTVQTFKNNSNNELVAYVVSDKEWDDSIKDDICDYVAERKPEYMVPSYVICLDEIPLNVNGKVDKRALPEVDISSLSVEYAAPTNETEKIIVDAFEEVFDREKISIYDDFTHLGGDSLTAIRLLSYLKDLNISAGDILSLRTPQAIANSVSEVSLDLDIYSLYSGCPLNEPQLNVYLDIIANDKKDSYLIPFSTNIPSKYNVDEVKSALDVMLDVHPILGMCVSDDFDVPYLVRGSKPSTIVEFDVDDEFLTKPFDLHDSLCRFLLVDNSDSFVLFAVFHHIIFDAVSADVFERDLYAILDGEVVEVDDSFLKVSAFNQQIAESSDYTEAEEFYEYMLADIDDAGELLDSVLADGPGSISVDLDLNKDIFDSFLDEHNISENVLFSGVFAYTLSRFVASETVFFNIVENGRDRFRNYDSIGMFVNTLPVVMDCKNQDINSFMDKMSDRVYGVMRHNYYPFRLLANKYDINSDILFQFLPEWIKETNDSDKKIIEEKNDLINNIGDLNSDFTVEIIQKGNDYVLNVTYCEKYSKDFINHFIESYKFILTDMLSVNELCDINYISSDDLDFLDDINDTEHDLAYDDILDAFNDNLSKYPDNKLVSYNDVSYSYGEGAFIAQRIAKSLTELGVEHQDCVGFLVPRSELYMLSVLGILSHGAIYVPLDDKHPDERLKFILEDSDCSAVIVNDETYERLSNLEYDGAVLNVSTIINEDIDSLSHLPVVYGDLACILYTSGTTGIPKGVKITRKSIVNYIEYYVIKSKISHDDVFALYASIGFDVGAIKSIFVPIYSGACLDIVPNDIRLDMNKLNEHFHDKNINHAHLPTQVAKLFLDTVDNHSLDVLCTGGEKLGEVNYSCDYIFVDSYGPTEACVSVTAIKEEDKIDSTSIGHLLDNLKAYVLDDESRRVPVGAVGELYLSGIQLADGYLNRDEETEKAFLNNPFENDENYAELYRTGDMVRVLPDGSLGIVGRRDKQVKIRGNRVELLAIEFVIREIDYIENVTVQTFKNNSNNELVAYVVLNKELDKEWDDIKEDICDYVAERKPEYMVPSFVIQLDEIPLNVNGKVDKRALPEVDISSLSVEYAAPTNEIEEQIINAFEVVFNQKGIGLNDDFSRLGGDSISAIRLISLLEKDGITCSARDILSYKTPYLIAQNVEKISKKSYDATVGEVDLLPIQSYFFDNVNSNEFSQEFILKSKTDLDLDTLQSAFDELSNIHDMLRTTYRYDKDSVVQEILPLDTRICEIKEYTITDDLNKTITNTVDESRKSLDITGDLIKINLLHCDDESYVVFVIHHLIIDGVSWSILIDDLTHIINQIKNNEEISLLRPYPYKDWVENVKSLVEDISNDEKQHWTAVNDLLDDSLIEGESKGFNFNLDVSFDVDNLLMLTEEEYLALCIARAFKKTYNQNIIFNRESYGRDENLADVSRTIGWFTSQFPVLIDTDNGYDIVSLMHDVYNIKEAFKGINHLGLNYESMIYTTNELEYKHCPVTFNFLSSEFSFENELFESFNPRLSDDRELELIDLDQDSFGISLNVLRADDHYTVGGDYADGTYLGDKFSEFIENIKYELEFIGDYDSDVIACCLSESQLGIYLDEKINDMGTAYATPGVFECPEGKSIDEIEDAIHKLIENHPILKGHVVDGDVPLLVCDNYPSIEITESDDYSELIKPFDLNESLARFYIMENTESKSIFYDMHHIISDATTRTIINNDLTLAFDNVLEDNVDLGFVYASRDSFNSKFESIYDEAYEFYRNSLSEIDETSTLLEDLDGADNNIKLPIPGVREDVEAFCRDCGITVNNLFNAIFAYTYSRFTGSENVFYTFTEHGRHDNYTQNALGMFVRTVPIIVNCKNTSVKDYLSYVSDLILDSMKYSVYPFRLLASEFDLIKDISFEYNSDLNDVSGIGDELIIEDLTIGLISDFLCVVNDLSDGYIVSVESCSKYSNDTIIRFLNAFKEILIGMLDSSNLSDIEYISSEDMNLLDKINNNEHDFGYDDILDAFNDNLSKYPDNKLVSYNDVSYSYGEGAFIASRIAESLTDLGVMSQDCVGFLVPRSELYMFPVLGVLSMGAVYVPLDDKHPDERLKFILEDSDCKVVIVNDETNERLSNLDYNGAVLNVSDIIKDHIDSIPCLSVNYSDLACILYTSGTTGLPKGVKVTRKSVINVVADYAEKYGITNGDVYALYSAIGFDGGSLAILQSIYSGACLDVIPEDIRLNMDELNAHFTKHNVTHTMMTTQVGKLFMNNVDNDSLDVLLVGGEKLGDFKNNNEYLLLDGYGPTEAFCFISLSEASKKIDNSSIGTLNYNVKAYVLDTEGRRVPLGAVGELGVSGCQVADGYLNREEETIKAFITNPFEDDTDYSVIYRTGDMVRVLPDGSLGIVGRRDSQVKIRGNRVELSAIESVIREIDYVDDVTVQTIKNNTNNELVAYVVADEEWDDSIKDDICDYVGERKPSYMVPSYVICLDEIPLNVNGKVDRRALPEVDISSLSAEYVAPTNEIEEQIVSAFEVVFNQERIGLNDDFVHLGGDSISAIRIISLLEKDGITCTARDILSYKTPYLIAQNVEKISKKSYDATVGEVDLLPIQNFFFDKIKNDEFSQEFILKSKTDLDLDTLQSAFDELSNIHDMLRATYRYDKDSVVQEILPLDTRICEIKEYTITDDLNKTINSIIDESRKSLDITGDLIKISLLHYDDESYVIFVIHHLIIDGVSWSILIDDLTYIINQIKNNEEISLLRPYPYKDWVEDTKSLVEDISNIERQHWTRLNRLLDDSLIKGKSKGFTYGGVEKIDVNKLVLLSEEEYLALPIARAFKKTYNQNIIFNRESHGRDENLADASRTIGWFTSQFPILVDTDNGYDTVSWVNDVYRIKEAFNDVNHLGLNYESMIYTTNELEYKHCPVTFNFLSNEFSFTNEMFESFNPMLSYSDELEIFDLDQTSFGITLNVFRTEDNYVISGHYADGTYLGDKFHEFMVNVKYEFEYIEHFISHTIACCMAESQLGVYVDEKVHDMGTAYSAPGIVECPEDKSIDEIKDAIHKLIKKHPILKSRIIDGDVPLLVSNSYPSIEILESDVDDYSELIKPFDLNESMARFYIIEKNSSDRVIFYDIHHIITDATSNVIVKKDLTLALDGVLDDNEEIGFLYANNESYKHQFEKIYDEAYEFYRNSLSEIDETSTLLEDPDGVDNNIKLPISGIREDVESFCRDCGITVSNLFNAIFAYTYSRFTGKENVYYTFTEHGRHDEYTQDALGMFVRTVPIIVNCKNTAVKDYLSNVSDLILDSMKYSVYPFRLLASQFDLNDGFSFEYNSDLNDVSCAGDEIIIEDTIRGLVSDFLCVVNDLSDGYIVTIESSSKFSNDTVIRFLNTFKEILMGMLNCSNLSDIEYVSSDDLILLDNINDNEHELDYDDILEAFNDKLSMFPDNKLVSYEDKSYSYAEGAFIASRIAESLTNLGVEPQDCVGFLVPRSELYMLSVLGILSLGAVYVPLDDTLPDERIKFIINDTQSKVVIVNDETYDYANNLVDNDDIVLLNISDIIDGEINQLDELPVVYGDLACILYTSGTTGLPKGVKITRKSVVNVVSCYGDEYGLGSNDVYGLFASIGFDAASFAITAVLYAGACLSIIPEDIRLNIDGLNKYFVENGVTHTFITTQVGKLFAQSIDDVSLDVLLVGGEKLGEFESSDDYTFVDIYGPTEAFTYISLIENKDKIDYSSVGPWNYNLKCYIVDEEFRRVPIGAVGELCIAGCQVADGYLNREEETEKAFVKNPFDNDKEYARMYRTGDLARLLPDDSVSIVGRRDSQVKIRGNRVELAAIEVVIREIDYIDDVTVQTIKNNSNNEVVAYVVLNQKLDKEWEDIKDDICEYVTKRKPIYMVPSYVIQLDEIPLNVNSKVDKRALPEVDKVSLSVEYVAPRNETEEIIVDAFEEVFNLENIGIYDDFIRLGGDSIITIKLASILSEHGIDIDSRSIFQVRTPYNIAKIVKGNEKEYGFTLAKEGTSNQNMFLLPPFEGLSFIFTKLIKEIDFDGNIYIIDDYQYELSVDEIRDIDGPSLAFEKYWDAIQDIFQDGDILAGYSMGCLHLLLLCERLEKSKKVEKCVLIDGTLNFVNDDPLTDKQIDLLTKHIEETYSSNINDAKLAEKMVAVAISNYRWKLPQPKVNSHVIYISAANKFKDELDDVASDYEFINIDSTHEDIIDKDIDKILKYLK